MRTRLTLAGVTLKLGVRVTLGLGAMFRMGKRLETCSWRLIIYIENYIASKGRSLLQAQGPNLVMMTVIDQNLELLLVNPFPIGRNDIIDKGVEVQSIEV